MAATVRVEGSRLPLGQQRYTVLLEPGLSVAEVVARCSGGSESAVMVDNAPVPRERWDSIVVREGQVVTVAPMAGAEFVITAIVAIGLSLVASLLLAPPTPEDQRDPDPRVEGGENRLAPWQPLPVVFGQLRYAPPIVNAWVPYVAASSTFTGARQSFLPTGYPSLTPGVGDNVWQAVGTGAQRKQWVRTLLCWGLGTVDVTDIKLGATLASEYGDAVSLMTAVGDNSDFEHATRVVAIGADLNGASTVTRFLGKAESTITVNFAWPRGLFRQNNKGEIHGFDEPAGPPERRPVLLTVRILDSADNSELATRDVTAVGGTSEQPWHSSETLTIAGEKQVVLEVRRTTAARDSARVNDDLKIESCTIPLTDNPINGITTTNTSVRIQATDQIADTVPVISGIASAHHPDWDADTETWVTRATRNPASAFRAVLMGSGTARPYAESQILQSRLQEWHEWCDDEGYTYDAVITRQTSVDSMLEQIAGAGRARSAWVGGLRGVVIDRAKAHRVQVFTPANSADLQATRAQSAVPHGLKCRFRDRNADYKTAQIIVYRPGYNDANATRIETRDLPGVTHRDRVSGLLAYHIRSALNRREQYQLRVDWEHLVAGVGDRVAVLHDAVDPEAHTGRAIEVVERTTLFALNSSLGFDAQYTGSSTATAATVVFAADATATGVAVAESGNLRIDVTVGTKDAATTTRRLIAAGINAAGAVLEARVSSGSDADESLAASDYNTESFGLSSLAAGAMQNLVLTEYAGGIEAGNVYAAVVRRGDAVASYAVALENHYAGVYLRLTGTDGRPDVEAGDLTAVHQAGTGIEDCILESVNPSADAAARLTMVQYGGSPVFNSQEGYTVQYIDPEGEIEDIPFGVFELARRAENALAVERVAYKATMANTRPARPAGEDIPADWSATEPTGTFIWISRQPLTVYPLVAVPAPATYEIVPTVHVPVGSEVDAGVWSEPEPYGGATVMGDVDGFGIEEAYALFPSSVLASDGALTIPTAQQPLNTWGYDILRQDDAVDGSGPQTLDGIVWTDGPSLPTAALPIQVKALRSVPGQPQHGATPAASWGDWAWYPSQLYASSVNYRELSIYQKVALSAAAPAAPASPTWDQSAATAGGLGMWSETFPTYDPNTEKVACAILLVGSDNSASVLGGVRFCENPGDINAVFVRSETQPARLADSGSRLPDNTYDTDQTVPDGPGSIWVAVGNRAPNATMWMWSAWDKLEGTDGRYAAKELDVYRVVDAPAAGGTAPATPTATRYVFDSDGLFGLTMNWVRTRPLAVEAGKLVYCCTASVQDNEGTGEDTSIAFSAPVICNDVLDIDIIYGNFSNPPPKPANTAHDTIAPTWYARPGLIPDDVIGELWECVRYLRISGDNIRWEHDDPLRVGGGETPPYFLQSVVEVPIRAFGESINAAPRFDPNPAETLLTLIWRGQSIGVVVSSAIAADGVTPTLTGDNADQFEIVT